MTLIGISSDEHLDMYKNLSKGIVTRNGYTKRLQELVDDAKRQIDRLVDQHGIWILVRSGDLFNSRTAINAMTLSAATEILTYRENDIRQLVIAGNHDEYLFDSRIRSIQPFIHTVKLFPDCNGTVFDDIAFYGISYTHLVDEFFTLSKTLLDEYNGAKFKILFIHQELSDVAVDGDGTTIDSKLSMARLKEYNFDFIICGHHHFPCRSQNVIVPGSATQLNFGDAGSTRGVWILDTEKQTLKQLESTAPQFIEILAEDLDNQELMAYIKQEKPYVKLVHTSNTVLMDKQEKFVQDFVSSVVIKLHQPIDVGIESFDPIMTMRGMINTAPDTYDRDVLNSDFDNILKGLDR